MSREFEGKRVLVTGATRGIGRGITERLVKEGATVFALSKTPENLEKLKSEIPEVKTLLADISDVGKVEEVLGPHHPFDLLVNNAGVCPHAYFLHTSQQDYDNIMATNMRGTFFITQMVAKGMIEKGVQEASIVMISSIAARRYPTPQIAYAGSKAGLDRMAEGMAVELGKYGIRVNTVNPGVIMTDMAIEGRANAPKDHVEFREKHPVHLPLGSWPEVEDVVEAVLFYLSRKSRKITGDHMMVASGV